MWAEWTRRRRVKPLTLTHSFVVSHSPPWATTLTRMHRFDWLNSMWHSLQLLKLVCEPLGTLNQHRKVRREERKAAVFKIETLRLCGEMLLSYYKTGDVVNISCQLFPSKDQTMDWAWYIFPLDHLLCTDLMTSTLHLVKFKIKSLLFVQLSSHSLCSNFTSVSLSTVWSWRVISCHITLWPVYEVYINPFISVQ